MDKLSPERLFKGVVSLLASKTIWLSLLAIILTTVLFMSYYLENIIYIIDGNMTTVAVTSERDAMKILADEEILTTKNDTITYSSPTVNSTGTLVIQRGYPVSVTVDGETHSHNWFGGTVRELLVEAGVALDTHDKLTHDLDDVLDPYENVTVTRVIFRSFDDNVTLPMLITNNSTSLLTKGKSEVQVKGEDGLRVDTYDEILEDGVVIDTILSSSIIVKEATEQITLVGDGSACSNFDFSNQFPLDENGVPLNYVSVYENQRATGYSTRNTSGITWGAWGRDKYCETGTVAVRSNEIPYGTKMYIRTSEGDFIYGYAIANDTGTALVEGIIDVDLYYDTYRESVLNAVRWVDIYILE